MSILVNATVVDGPLNEFLCSFCRPIVESLAIFFPFFLFRNSKCFDLEIQITEDWRVLLKTAPAQEQRNNDVMLLSFRESAFDVCTLCSDGLNKHFGK